MFNSIKIALVIYLVFACHNFVQAQFEITHIDNPYPGYLFFDNNGFDDFGVVDNYGYTIFTNSIVRSSAMVKYHNNGLWSYLDNNKYYIYDKKFNLLDSIPNPTTHQIDFHDFLILSNGRYLIMLRANNTVDMSEIVPGGKKDANLITNNLIEVDRTGKIYWEWKSLDHLPIKDVTSRINLTMNNIDLTHFNSMDEDYDGNILVSVRHYDEVIKINRQNGNIIWRLGGSTSKGNQFKILNDSVNGFVGFSHQHTATRLPNGNILIYDNGNLKEPQYSRAVEYSLDETNLVATKVWEYRAEPDIYQALMGSAFRLPNGNTLINWGKEMITEVKPDKSIAFQLKYDEGIVYKAVRVNHNTDVVFKNVQSTGTYTFNDAEYQTGITLELNQLNGAGSINIQKHTYAPHKADFTDSSFSDIYPYRWVIGHHDIKSLSGKIKISLSKLSEITNPLKTTVYMRQKEGKGKFTPLNTIYDANNKLLIADFFSFGEVIIVSNQINTNPLLISPENDASVFLNLILEWSKVSGASSYQILVDTVSSFTNPIFQINTPDTKYNLKDLKENVTYLWKVRAVNKQDTSNWSVPRRFLTNVSAPILLSPEYNKIGVRKNEPLTWSEINNVVNYQVNISESDDFINIITDTVVNQTHLLLPEYVNYDKTYYWKVRAVRLSDTSEWSTIGKFITELQPPTLLSPQNKQINISQSHYFSWTPTKGANSYSFELSETEDFEYLIFSDYDVQRTNIYIFELQTCKDYFWRVKAKRETDSSLWSEIYSFSTVLTAPKLILPNQGHKDYSLFLPLVWEFSPNASSYSVQIALDADFSNLITDENQVSTNEYYITFLEPLTTYYWRVKAFFGVKESAYSKVRYFTTDEGKGIAAPIIVFPKNEELIDLNGCLIWSEIPNVLSYQLQIATYNFSNIIVNELHLKDNSYSIKNLKHETVYYWRVKAIGKYAQSDWSEISSFATPINFDPLVLLYPSNQDLQIPLETRLIWELKPELPGYDVQISLNKDFSHIIIDSSDIAEPYVDVQLPYNNTTYYWRLRGSDKMNKTPWSTIRSFKTISEPELNEPELIYPEDRAKGISSQFDFTWRSIPEAKFYKIMLSTSRYFVSTAVAYQSIEPIYTNCCELVPGTTYFWRVATFNDSTSSKWSQVYSFLTSLHTPVIYYPISGSIDIPFDAPIIFEPIGDNSYYHIQISLDSLFNLTVVDEKDITNSQFQPKLEQLTQYYVRVRQYNDTNESAWSQTVSFKTGSSSDIRDGIFNEINISVQPNPITQVTNFIIHSEKYGSSRLAIYNLFGNEVANIYEGNLEQGTTVLNWNKGSLTQGIYFYKLMIDGHYKTGKLIIIDN